MIHITITYTNNTMDSLLTSSINFDQLGLPIPNLVLTLPVEKQREIFNYLSQLDELNKKAYLIAQDHLGSSFNIYKSNGYKDWIIKK